MLRFNPDVIESGKDLEVVRLVTHHTKKIETYEVLAEELNRFEELHVEIVDTSNVVAICCSAVFSVIIALFTSTGSSQAEYIFAGLLTTAVAFGLVAARRCNNAKKQLRKWLGELRGKID